MFAFRDADESQFHGMDQASKPESRRASPASLLESLDSDDSPIPEKFKQHNIRQRDNFGMTPHPSSLYNNSSLARCSSNPEITSGGLRGNARTFQPTDSVSAGPPRTLSGLSLRGPLPRMTNPQCSSSLCVQSPIPDSREISPSSSMSELSTVGSTSLGGNPSGSSDIASASGVGSAHHKAYRGHNLLPAMLAPLGSVATSTTVSTRQPRELLPANAVSRTSPSHNNGVVLPCKTSAILDVPTASNTTSNNSDSAGMENVNTVSINTMRGSNVTLNFHRSHLGSLTINHAPEDFGM